MIIYIVFFILNFTVLKFYRYKTNQNSINDIQITWLIAIMSVIGTSLVLAGLCIEFGGKYLNKIKKRIRTKPPKWM